MLSAVQFYDQICCRRIKISDVFTDRFLPIEPHTVDLFSLQAMRQMDLGVGRMGRKDRALNLSRRL
ncbi:MAG TPA: hypothetical protein VMT22_17950 [Terriglobales bacterium]|jgi:hypothetical protein|nr:hypothetical protein [Terriglobales bacterium]